MERKPRTCQDGQAKSPVANFIMDGNVQNTDEKSERSNFGWPGKSPSLGFFLNFRQGLKNDDFQSPNRQSPFPPKRKSENKIRMVKKSGNPLTPTDTKHETQNDALNFVNNGAKAMKWSDAGNNLGSSAYSLHKMLG